MDPDAYTEMSRLGRKELVWVEHRKLFSLNPSLIRRRVVEAGWPAGNEAEKTMLVNLDPENRQAYWGARTAGPIVEHIGMARTIGWRL